MIDIRAEVRRYTDSDPYEFVRIKEPDSNQQVRFHLRITDQPDPMLATVIGDFVHNLRCALDHVIVAAVPKQERKNAGFPFSYVDIFEQDSTGEFMVEYDEARKNFERSITGLDPDARAILISAQPYWMGTNAHLSTLGIISRLDNADKHRMLAVIGTGVRNLVATATAKRQTVQLVHRIDPRAFVEDGTVAGWNVPDYLTPSEVRMEYSATTVVHVKMTGVRGNEPRYSFPIGITVVMALREVRRMLQHLEPFTR